VCWVLNKLQKLFFDSKLVQECMLEVATEIFEENKKNRYFYSRYFFVG